VLESPGFAAEARSPSLLAKLTGLAGMLDRNEIAALPGNIDSNAVARPPGLHWRFSRRCCCRSGMTFFDVKLAEAIDDRGSFPRF